MAETSSLWGLVTSLLLIVNVNNSHGYFYTVAGCPIAWREPCNSKLVKFYLHTRETAGSGGEFVEFLENGWNNLSSSRFQADRPSVVLIHGYTDSPRLNSLQRIKQEYLDREERNVWFLDWSLLTPEPCYLSSVYNLEHVGRCLASFVTALGRPTFGLHVIGFSLGGHAAALAANHLRPYLIPRITGLDPAMPLFVGIGHQQRLSPDDGGFVDVIHTNSFLQGNYKQMGHVDFFLNGGVNQPGCGSLFKSIECSHERAPWYYAESINSKVGFWGWPCDKFLDILRNKCEVLEPFHIMGDPVSNTTRGMIYVSTNDKKPFAKGRPNVENLKNYRKANKNPATEPIVVGYSQTMS